MTQIPDHFWDFMEDGNFDKFVEKERGQLVECPTCMRRFKRGERCDLPTCSLAPHPR